MQIVRGVQPDDSSRRQVAADFRRLVEAGASLEVAGAARHNPRILLGRGYLPRHRLRLFGAEFYLTDPIFDEGLGFFIAYVAFPSRDGRVRRFYPRVFYKDSSLVWRVASHFVHTEHEFWIGKGDLRTVEVDGDEMVVTAEETTNLPFEVQGALDFIRGDRRPRRDDLAIERVLREGPARRMAPYADFTTPRRRAQSRYRIHDGEPIASFARPGDPTSLRFAAGFDPDFEEGVVEETRAASRFFGGALRKVRVLSENRLVQFLFMASPTHAWVNPPQALTTELSTYGVRVHDVIAPDDLCVPAYEYHFWDDTVDPPSLHSQIPPGYAGDAHPLDPSRADASRWVEALPVIQEFRARVVGKRRRRAPGASTG